MIVPLIAGLVLIPVGQQIYTFGVHWYLGRILILAVLGRVLIMHRTADIGAATRFPNSLDIAFAGSLLCEALAMVLLYQDANALINRFGFLIDFLACYYVVRVLIEDEVDLYLTLKCLAILATILASSMAVEQVMVKNVFGLLGGPHVVPDMRAGKIRSQGPFHHSLTAGVFGATLLPLFVMYWNNAKGKWVSIVGVVGCTVMTICSNSSTPLLGWMAGTSAVCLWPARRYMPLLRRVLVVVLLALHVVMKAPVWFLIARIDLTGGSSGFHRAQLVDSFLQHLGDWWLIGTSNAGSWGWDLWDTQNQFVTVGQTGGALALILLIVVLKLSYSRIGSFLRTFEGTPREWQAWCLGAATFSHIVCFFGVNYSDQVRVGWFILLAILIAATGSPRKWAVGATVPESRHWWGAASTEPARSSAGVRVPL